jgi:hypothetical protein
VLKGYGGTSTEAYYEVNPLERGKKTQKLMSDMFSGGGGDIAPADTRDDVCPSTVV